MDIISENNCTKTYSELNRWDVIEAYHGKRWKQCIVLSCRQKDGAIALKLHPFTTRTRRITPSKVETYKFQPNAQVEVIGAKQILTIEGQNRETILSILRPGREPLNAWQIFDEAKALNRPIPYVKKIHGILKDLRREGALILRDYGKRPYARAPLPVGEIGLPVIELPQTRSAALGWIEDWKQMQNDSFLPVVRFLDGTRRACPEQRLDPTENPLYVKWVEQVRADQVEEPPTLLPRDMVAACDIRNRYKSQAFLSEAAEVAIARHLGLVPSHYASFRSRDISTFERDRFRLSVLDYLNTYYPGWSFGVNVHRFKSAPGQPVSA